MPTQEIPAPNLPDLPQKQYSVGDSLTLVNRWHHVSQIHGDNAELCDGQQILEVEVKSVKTAKVTLE